MSIFASIPSPSQGVWYLGPLPIRAYALAILTGIIVAYWLSNRRYIRKGGGEEVTIDVVVWMVIVGILGARVYHLMTSPDAYFGAGGDPWKALRIWEGGLGIWGAVVAGAGDTSRFIAETCGWLRSPTPLRLVWFLRRRSAGGGITSTRNFSGARQRCRGVWK